ncbi:MAG: CCA tRNA nucleotidyltransferase, partial [Deltaproteobacteria bacterium]
MTTPPPHDPLAAGARAIVATLRAAGYSALWAGGAVRDRLLERTPKDYDVTTDADPDEVAALFSRSVPVGAQFGITRVIHAGHEYEVARFRAEGPREDALHRDFTINGLLYDPVEERIIDHVGGAADLAARRLRACGPDPEGRFQEDALRVLRGVRFAAQLDLTIEERTWEAMRGHARRALETSAERQRDELARMLTGPAPARAFALLDALDLGAALLPE